MAASHKMQRLAQMLEEVERLAGLRGGTYIQTQREDGSWSPIPDDLPEDCVIIAECTFSHIPHNKFSYPPYGSPPRSERPAHTSPRTPDPAAHLERKHAMATRQQVPLDREKLDKS